jgi:hypothetical protein
MRKGKQTRQLPTRGGLNDLDRSGRTIVDYAKATPVKPDRPAGNILQNLRNPRKSVG